MSEAIAKARRACGVVIEEVDDLVTWLKNRWGVGDDGDPRCPDWLKLVLAKCERWSRVCYEACLAIERQEHETARRRTPEAVLHEAGVKLRAEDDVKAAAVWHNEAKAEILHLLGWRQVAGSILAEEYRRTGTEPRVAAVHVVRAMATFVGPSDVVLHHVNAIHNAMEGLALACEAIEAKTQKESDVPL